MRLFSQVMDILNFLGSKSTISKSLESLPFIDRCAQKVQRLFLTSILRKQAHLKPFYVTNKTIKALVICCYMADRPNCIHHILNSVREAKITNIDFVVTNNTRAPSDEAVKPFVKYRMPNMPKYKAVDLIIREQFKSDYDYVMIIDDDVMLPSNFFDNYFTIIRWLELTLSQPALTQKSYGSFLCNRQIRGAIAHLTAFAETGPVTCFEKKLVPLVPWGDGSPMGWGLDFVWSRICMEKGWRIGVIDCTPVEHIVRKVGKYYATEEERRLMKSYLSKVRHVPLCATNIIGPIIPFSLGFKSALLKTFLGLSYD